MSNIYAIIIATIIVKEKSTIAILNTLYECIPVFGAPKISLYLHKLIII
jgi:hypothetical protein